MADIITDVINQTLDAQRAQQLQAGRYERTEDRQACRNGCRTHILCTRDAI